MKIIKLGLAGNYKMLDTFSSLENSKSYQFCTFDYDSRIRKATLSDESTANSITNNIKNSNENIIKEKAKLT